MRKEVRLCDMVPGQTGIVAALDSGSPITHRLMDLGLVKGSRVTCLGKSLWKEPTAYDICGAVIALRREVSQSVLVREIEAWKP